MDVLKTKFDDMKPQEIRVLIELDRYDEALAACATALADRDENRHDILRVRAQAYFMSGDYESALHDYNEIIESGFAELRDYYLAAFDALYLYEFSTSERLLKKLIELGEEEGDTWFAAASYFYLAYAEMELGELTSAIRNLELAVMQSPDISLPIPGVGTCSHIQLRAEIGNRLAN